MKQLLPLLAIASLTLSCESETFTIDKDYIVNTSQKPKTSNNLSEMKKSLSGINNKRSETNYSTVNVSDEVVKIFDSETCPCQLPDKVKKSLKGKNWMPNDVKAFLKKSFPEQALYLRGESAVSLLHKATFKTTTGTTFDRVVAGAPTFKNLDISRFILREAKDNFVYTLDCSGYLNVSISACGGAPGIKIKTEAESALKNQHSLFVAGGTVVSPIAAAYYGNTLGVNLDTNERIKILQAIINLPDVSDSDSIVFQSSFQMLWTNNNGNSSFNGKGQIGGNGNAGFGIAEVSFNSQSGGQSIAQVHSQHLIHSLLIFHI